MKNKNETDFFENQAKLLEKGHKIVLAIIAFNVICIIITAFIQFNLISIIYNLILNFLLYSGFKFIRYLFAVGSILAALVIFINYLVFLEIYGAFFTNIYCVYAIICLFIAYALFKNQAVSEFLYSQRNG